MKLKTPHIPLGISLDEGLQILKFVSLEIEKDLDEKENFYKVSADDFECGLYEKDGIVIASWFNDPIGRDFDEGISEKVTLYVARYGEIDDWEERLNNGHIQFFFNEKAKVNLAYGLHADVLRFNKL